jgi:hypothetical protein
MIERGTSRAGNPASAQNDVGYGDEDPNWEDPIAGHESGIQGDGGQGLEDPEDAALNAGTEQEVGGEEDLDPYDEPVTPQPRGQNRFQRLSNENAELKRQLDTERRMRQPASPATPQTPQAPRMQDFSLAMEDEATFKARLDLVSADERYELRQQRSEQRNELRYLQQQFNTAQQQDKISWDASCASNQRRQRWSERVEQERERLIRENGQYVNREVVYKFLLGEWLDSPDGQKRMSKRREAARQRVQSQETRPVSPRSDADRTQRGRLSERDARARRLEGQQI